MSANVSPMSEHLKLLCDGPITIEECLKVLPLFKNNKSPGNDGITMEFYKHFWNSMSDILIDCFNYSYKYCELSCSQQQAIISLLEKPGKDRQFIKNWRPISLFKELRRYYLSL